VTVHRIGGDAFAKVAEIRVGAAPPCVAITPDDAKVYVTNAMSGTVSVIDASLLRQTRARHQSRNRAFRMRDHA
jgi:DNA-binding beta-propeller fold protein YncE